MAGAKDRPHPLEGHVSDEKARRRPESFADHDNLHAATDQIVGAPSVPFDTVAVLPDTPSAVDFLSNALVHCQFVGSTEQASDLINT